jgi:hypothetical protein
MCPIPAARAPAATLLLSCLQDSAAWLAPGASTSGVKRVQAPDALSARSREDSVATEMLVSKAEQVSDDGRRRKYGSAGRPVLSTA